MVKTNEAFSVVATSIRTQMRNGSMSQKKLAEVINLKPYMHKQAI